MALTFDEARACVIEKVAPCMPPESLDVRDPVGLYGRVLAEEIHADRDYPPFPRSARDGFALRAANVPGTLDVIGEVRAGQIFQGSIGPRQAVEIMTGAPVPDGADAIVMVEHVSRNGSRVTIDRNAKSGDNFTPLGAEAKAGDVLLTPGKRLSFAEIALLATVGRTSVMVSRRPRVAILSTGDEVVEIGEQPLGHQIRNSNASSLAVQVARAGGIPVALPIARDVETSTRPLIEEGLKADLLLISGGVSAGKYDIVEKVLAMLGAEFFFDRVLIQPGAPLVFGRTQGKFFFGLPGNPASTMITFETIARAAMDRMQGISEPALPLLRAKLSRAFRTKPGLTRFLPAQLSSDGSTIEPARTQGSGDAAALAQCNAFLVTEPGRESWDAGEDIRVLLK